jgi:hypothetical protein
MVKKKPAMKGGFFLTDRFTTAALAHLGGPVPNRADQRYVDLFYSALNQTTAGFELLSDTSLYGFLFRQDVNPGFEPAEEYVFNAPGCNVPTAATPRFSETCFRPLGSYIHKVVFVGAEGTEDTEYRYTAPTTAPPTAYRPPTTKALEGQARFAREAAIQFSLWRDFNGGITMVPPILTPTPAFVRVERFREHPLISRCLQNEKFAAAADSARMVGATGACIITMGLANGYRPLQSFIRPGDDATTHYAATLGRMAHIILLLKNKYIHGDAHTGNIMISETERDWMGRGIPGRALLIDFGRTIPITDEQYRQTVGVIAQNPARPRPWHRLLRFIREAVRQNAYWLEGQLFAGENINGDVDRGIETLGTSWIEQGRLLGTIREFAALGEIPASSDVERIIKRTKGLTSLFGPPPAGPPPAGPQLMDMGGEAPPRIRTRRRFTRRTKKSSKTRKRVQKNASLREKAE